MKKTAREFLQKPTYSNEASAVGQGASTVLTAKRLEEQQARSLQEILKELKYRASISSSRYMLVDIEDIKRLVELQVFELGPSGYDGRKDFQK